MILDPIAKMNYSQSTSLLSIIYSYPSLEVNQANYRRQKVNQTRQILFTAAVRGESDVNYRFPSLNQWDTPLVEQRYDMRPYLRSLGTNRVSGDIERAEEKSPRTLSVIPLRHKIVKLATEEEKPKRLGDDQETQDLRSLSTSEKKLREALGQISIQKDGIAKKKNSFSVRQQEKEQRDQKIRKIKFNPSKRVLVGQQKLRTTLPRAQSAEATLQRVNCISALKRLPAQKESEYQVQPPLLQVQAHNSKERCRRGLQYLYSYVSSIRKMENKKLPNIVDQESNESEGKLSDESELSTTDLSFQDSKLDFSIDKEEDKIKLMATQKSTNSDFSPTYYRHLSSLLSDLEEEPSPQRAGSANKLSVKIPKLDLSRCRKRERSPSADSKMYQKWYKQQEGEVEASESLILSYTFKLKKCKQY